MGGQLAARRGEGRPPRIEHNIEGRIDLYDSQSNQFPQAAADPVPNYRVSHRARQGKSDAGALCARPGFVTVPQKKCHEIGT